VASHQLRKRFLLSALEQGDALVILQLLPAAA